MYVIIFFGNLVYRLVKVWDDVCIGLIIIELFVILKDWK